MTKVYVMATCPDCSEVKERLSDNPDFEIIDIGEHVRNLKEFIRLRDSSPAFDSVKAAGPKYFSEEDDEIPAIRQSSMYNEKNRRTSAQRSGAFP